MDSAPVEKLTSFVSKYTRLYQMYLDKSVPFTLYRWIGFGALLIAFLLRIIMAHGWYIVCYTLGIYLLNLFLAFLSPKFDPSLEQEQRDQDAEEGTGGELPKTDDEEFRPFIRRLPEFKFWHSATRATAIAFVLSWFSVFDIPVFWPILLIYFFTLFALTMRRQIQHMIKYRYLPFDIGKARYSRS